MATRRHGQREGPGRFPRRPGAFVRQLTTEMNRRISFRDDPSSGLRCDKPLVRRRLCRLRVAAGNRPRWARSGAPGSGLSQWTCMWLSNSARSRATYRSSGLADSISARVALAAARGPMVAASSRAAGVCRCGSAVTRAAQSAMSVAVCLADSR